MNGTITWLPIEDAPKDGSEILIASKRSVTEKKYYFHITWWDGEGWSGCKDAEPVYYGHINSPENQCL